MRTNERVFVVPTEIVNRFLESSELVVEFGNLKDGIRKLNVCALVEMLKYATFIEREHAEGDKSYKQIIPYVVFLSHDKRHIYLFKRTSNQTEKRLHNLYSLGIGGHINFDDHLMAGKWNDFSCNLLTLLVGAGREISEEVKSKPEFGMNSLFSLLPLTYVIDTNSSDVSSVHLGILSFAKVKKLTIREKENFELKKVRLDKLVDYYNEMEDWAKTVVLLLSKEKQIVRDL